MTAAVMRPETRVSHVTNTFVFSFAVARGRMAAAHVERLPRVLPLDEDEARTISRVAAMVGAPIE